MEEQRLRLLFPKTKLLLSPSKLPGIRWLIGSPIVLPSFTVVSSLRCLHALNGDPLTPDLSREADDLRTLLLRGFEVVGALLIYNGKCDDNYALKVLKFAFEMRKFLSNDQGSCNLIGAVSDVATDDIHFYFSESSNFKNMTKFHSIIYEDNAENFLWEHGCFLRCELPLELPVFVTMNDKTDSMLASVTDSVYAKLRDPHTAYLAEGPTSTSDGLCQSVILHGVELDIKADLSNHELLKDGVKDINTRAYCCSSFFLKSGQNLSSSTREIADVIRITIFSNQSRNIAKPGAPSVDCFPVLESARVIIVNFNLDILCYVAKDFPLHAAISKFIVPGVMDQLISMRKAISPNFLTDCTQLYPYHFLLPGVLHPITAIYDLRYGESEIELVEIRKSIHSRLGLPLDRPLLITANAINFGAKVIVEKESMRNGSQVLKDVHREIPGSGVFGGSTYLIDGSYEYYHYLLDDVDDNGWGCAYRSLQTIISWFRLQHYTSIKIPTHRDIQQALVEIGDKEPSFIGSREWIGAIELSFVLDKLLGVTCKIINVRSGDELPEKCRDLAMHFQTQGTPIMIGGGVLAYTLLGVDYNETTGESAFLILDPHYTGSSRDLKKIVSGGWCGWKKAVDSKGRNFFLADKFYNLLLPQRPNMV